MSILNDLKSIELDKNKRKVFGIKSGILWGHSNKTNGSYPLFYILKPKHMTQEDFDIILDHLEVKLYRNSKP